MSFVTLTPMQRRELSAVVNGRSVDAVVASRARMVLWRDEGYRAEAPRQAWTDRPKPGKPAQAPGSVRARILALTRMSPPSDTGLSHWSSREMAAI